MVDVLLLYGNFLISLLFLCEMLIFGVKLFYLKDKKKKKFVVYLGFGCYVL